MGDPGRRTGWGNPRVFETDRRVWVKKGGTVAPKARGQRLRGEGGREGGDGHGEGEEAPALPRGGHVLPVAQPDPSPPEGGGGFSGKSSRKVPRHTVLEN